MWNGRRWYSSCCASARGTAGQDAETVNREIFSGRDGYGVREFEPGLNEDYYGAGSGLGSGGLDTGIVHRRRGDS